MDTLPTPVRNEPSDPPPPLGRPPRRRGRTTLIITVAALLGIVAGTTAGYAVQAGREPTALPALNQPGLAYPAKSLPRGKEAEPLSANEDTGVKTAGDLRKLLIHKPAGALESDQSWIDDGWSPLNIFAYQGDAFEALLGSGLRRIASASWEQGDRQTNISLIQFRPDVSVGAADYEDQVLMFMAYAKTGATADAIQGSDSGRLWLEKPGADPDSTGYHARAVARRGDVVLDINIYDPWPIDKKDIRTLAERQLERL